ncbi:MAG: dissimilatory-type sulfite reductase subunit alpha [Gracilibacteraceae bacterium]|nr:dissimilatory-type sulfite reductase subunit alpha [Gracilibacteraceae bacterium]
MTEYKTPMMDELEKGPWPSFVTELREAAKGSAMAEDLIGQMEKSYEEKKGLWKHGGIVGVKGYGSGVIGRYSDLPEEFPNVREFHTMRVNQPGGWFYNTETLKKICDIWEEKGSGLFNFHGATGDIILLGTTTAELQPTFDLLSEQGFDLGGSGSALRTPSSCVGPARCEWACFDTLDLCYDLTMAFQDYMHRPAWPYKFKIKISGCPNDCVAAIARSDLSIIGTWKGPIQVRQEAVKEYAASWSIDRYVTNTCPTKAFYYDDEKKEVRIDNANCVRCMNCINKMPKALKPGKERGASLLIGGKATILRSAFMSWVIVPFMKMEPPYTELKDLIGKIWDWWDENAKSRERIGELIYRKGMPEFLRATGLPAVPQMVRQPRANPYVFWDQDDLEK